MAKANLYGIVMREFETNESVNLLRSLLDAIPKWEKVVEQEFADHVKEMEATLSPDELAYHQTYKYDDHFVMLGEAKEMMFAGLAVAIASKIEQFMNELCKQEEVTLPERASWGPKRNALASKMADSNQFAMLTGLNLASRARLLGNCFKHNGGLKDKELIDHIKEGDVGEKIKYGAEDWPAMISATGEFLKALGEVFPPPPLPPHPGPKLIDIPEQ